jgi:hypothetical protein
MANPALNMFGKPNLLLQVSGSTTNDAVVPEFKASGLLADANLNSSSDSSNSQLSEGNNDGLDAFRRATALESSRSDDDNTAFGCSLLNTNGLLDASTTVTCSASTMITGE